MRFKLMTDFITKLLEVALNYYFIKCINVYLNFKVIKIEDYAEH